MLPAAEQFVIFRVCADPEPNYVVALFTPPEYAVFEPDPRRIHSRPSSHRFERETGMERVRLEGPIGHVSLLPNGQRLGSEAASEVPIRPRAQSPLPSTIA